MTDRRRGDRDDLPWWASDHDPPGRAGAGPGGDPLGAHRAARRGDRRSGPSGASGTGGAAGGQAHEALLEAARVLREGFEQTSGGHAGRGAGTGRPGPGGDGDGPAQGAAGHEHTTIEACRMCPVCTLIRVVGEARPELAEHLSEAARHLGLAASALVETPGRPGERGLEHIDIEVDEDEDADDDVDDAPGV